MGLFDVRRERSRDLGGVTSDVANAFVAVLGRADTLGLQRAVGLDFVLEHFNDRPTAAEMIELVVPRIADKFSGIGHRGLGRGRSRGMV